MHNVHVCETSLLETQLGQQILALLLFFIFEIQLYIVCVHALSYNVLYKSQCVCLSPPSLSLTLSLPPLSLSLPLSLSIHFQVSDI